jgi:transcriptional regulator GlxA family with amidase domain
MKQVIIVVPKGQINLSSIAGSFEILTRANEIWIKMGNRPVMDVRIASFSRAIKLDVGFFSINPVDISEIKKSDLVIVPSLAHDYDNILRDNKELVGWIRDQYNSGAEIASICTGAFLVAATGLLEGRSCSTHWNAAEGFRRLFPNIKLHVDKLMTVEKGIYTNGGAYSFLNLILFLVEKYFDRQTAILCSKIFQIDIDRTSQSPFYIFRTQKNHGDELIQRAQTFIYRAESG